MKMPVQEGLFGESEVITDKQKKIEFSLDEVEKILEDAPRVMLDELADSLKSLRQAVHAQSGEKHELSTAKRRFWLNIEWVYELSETPAVLPFDLACGLEGVDSETLRNRISSAFADQIREFVSAYACAQPLDVGRVQRKLNRYINVAN